MSAWPALQTIIAGIAVSAVVNIPFLSWFMGRHTAKMKYELKWIKAEMRAHGWTAPNGDD